MDKYAYEDLIRELCRHVGIEDWHAVLEGQHLAVEDKIVGIMHEDDGDGLQTLSIYVDLGPVFPQADPDLYRRLLIANLRRPPSMHGHLGLHPHSGNATYHWRADEHFSMTGTALADWLVSQIAAASALLDELKRQEQYPSGEGLLGHSNSGHWTASR